MLEDDELSPNVGIEQIMNFVEIFLKESGEEEEEEDQAQKPQKLSERIRMNIYTCIGDLRRNDFVIEKNHGLILQMIQSRELIEKAEPKLVNPPEKKQSQIGVRFKVYIAFQYDSKMVGIEQYRKKLYKKISDTIKINPQQEKPIVKLFYFNNCTTSQNIFEKLSDQTVPPPTNEKHVLEYFDIEFGLPLNKTGEYPKSQQGKYLHEIAENFYKLSWKNFKQIMKKKHPAYKTEFKLKPYLHTHLISLGIMTLENQSCFAMDAERKIFREGSTGVNIPPLPGFPPQLYRIPDNLWRNSSRLGYMTDYKHTQATAQQFVSNLESENAARHKRNELYKFYRQQQFAKKFYDLDEIHTYMICISKQIKDEADQALNFHKYTIRQYHPRHNLMDALRFNEDQRLESQQLARQLQQRERSRDNRRYIQQSSSQRGGYQNQRANQSVRHNRRQQQSDESSNWLVISYQ